MQPLILNLDTKVNNYDNLDLMQGYDYTLQCNMFDNWVQIDLANVNIQVQMRKADKTFIIQTENITVNKNEITIEIDRDFTREYGKGEIQIVLEKNAKRFGSWVIDAKIKQSAINDNDGQSGNKITITEALNDKIVEAQETKKELDISINNGNVAKIRSDLDGVINVDIPKINSSLDSMAYYATPEMYGAKGDGVTDDTTAFKLMFSNSTYIEFNPKNKYYITEPLEVKSNTIINGNNSKIKTKSIKLNGLNNNGLFYIKGSDIEHYNLDTTDIQFHNGRLKILNSNLKVGDFIKINVDTGIYSTTKLTPSINTIAKVINIDSQYVYIDYLLPKDRWNFDNLTFTKAVITKVIVKENIIISNLEVEDVNYEDDYTYYSMPVISINCGHNISIRNVTLKNGVYSVIHGEYCHQCKYENIKSIKPRKTGGGEGYVIQNISSNGVYGDKIYGDETRHTLDFTSGGNCVFENITCLDNKSNGIQFHGNYEHDIILKNIKGTRVLDNEGYRVSFNTGSGEEFGNANTHITFENCVLNSHITNTNRYSKNFKFNDCDIIVRGTILNVEYDHCNIHLEPASGFTDSAQKRGSDIKTSLKFTECTITMSKSFQTRFLDEFIFYKCDWVSDYAMHIDVRRLIIEDCLVNTKLNLQNSWTNGAINNYHLCRNLCNSKVNGVFEVQALNKELSNFVISENTFLGSLIGIKFNGSQVTAGRHNIVITSNIDNTGVGDVNISGLKNNAYAIGSVKSNIGITDF